MKNSQLLSFLRELREGLQVHPWVIIQRGLWGPTVPHLIWRAVDHTVRMACVWSDPEGVLVFEVSDGRFIQHWHPATRDRIRRAIKVPEKFFGIQPIESFKVVIHPTQATPDVLRYIGRAILNPATPSSPLWWCHLDSDSWSSEAVEAVGLKVERSSRVMGVDP